MKARYRVIRISGRATPKTCRSYGVPVPLTSSRYETVNASEISTKSTSTSSRRRRWRTIVRSIQPPRTTSSVVLALEIDQEAGELHEQHERDEDADERDPVVAEHAVGEAGGAEAGGDRGEQDDRAVLGQPAPDEPVRAVVLAALVDGTSLDDPRDRDEAGVEDRDREHEQRQDERGDGRLRHLPARREPEPAEREAEHLAAGVAHEHRRGPPGAEVERQEAERAPVRARARGRAAAAPRGR